MEMLDYAVINRYVMRQKFITHQIPLSVGSVPVPKALLKLLNRGVGAIFGVAINQFVMDLKPKKRECSIVVKRCHS